MDYSTLLLYSASALLLVVVLIMLLYLDNCDDCCLNDNNNPYDLKWGRPTANSAGALDGMAAPVHPADMNEVDQEIWGIFKDAFGRYKRGEAQYGVLQIDKDQRDFLVESEQELLDSMVYDSVEISRLRRLREKRLRIAADY